MDGCRILKRVKVRGLQVGGYSELGAASVRKRLWGDLRDDENQLWDAGVSVPDQSRLASAFDV